MQIRSNLCTLRPTLGYFDLGLYTRGSAPMLLHDLIKLILP